MPVYAQFTELGLALTIIRTLHNNKHGTNVSVYGELYQS